MQISEVSLWLQAATELPSLLLARALHPYGRLWEAHLSLPSCHQIIQSKPDHEGCQCCLHMCTLYSHLAQHRDIIQRLEMDHKTARERLQACHLSEMQELRQKLEGSHDKSSKLMQSQHETAMQALRQQLRDGEQLLQEAQVQLAEMSQLYEAQKLDAQARRRHAKQVSC